MVRIGRRPSWSYPSYLARLPEHYYQFRKELEKPSARVHDRPPESEFMDLYYNKEKHKVERVADVPIEVLYPKEADSGIWGGEGIIKGYVKPRKYFQQGWPRPRYWFPHLKRSVFYSEILDKYFSIICTGRTLDLVDSFYGFDNYILRSKVQDLKSQLALSLRRQMLLTLANKKFNNPQHEREMLEKYKDCIIPAEEAEWFGLSVLDAVKKQKIEDARKNKPIPLKVTLAQELIAELQKMKDSGELDVIMKDDKKLGWLSKFKSNIPFLKSGS